MMRMLLDHLWQSTLFCAAAWLITLALRANSAAVRHGLWMLASLKFLVPFSALYLIGAVAGLPTPVESQPPLLGAALAVAAPAMTPALTLSGARAGAESALEVTLLAVWLAGATWLALGWLRGWRATQMLSRAARPAPGTPPGVYVTDAEVAPSVAGVLRPVVLLPAALLGRLTAAQLDAVLTHEREHISRRDNLLAQLHRLVETLFWFHPLVWWIGRRLTQERERACDEAVLAHGHEAGEYAAGILSVCRHCAAAAPRGVGALAGDLTARIGHILGGRAPRSVGFPKAFALTACSLAVGAAPFAAGAMDGALRRHAALINNARILRDADITIRTLPGADGRQVNLAATRGGVSIDNTSLRRLIALAYGVHESGVSGATGWLDAPRYEIRAAVHGVVVDPDDFDPQALQGLVNKLLAARFDLEIHVNQRCQDPCGRRALRTDPATP